MSCGSIYKISFPNGKHYIGLTTSLEQRTKEHKKNAKSGSSKYLYKAIRKYNMVDNLELIEIDTADTKDELCEKEIQYIQEYNSYYMNGNGYNMTYGGEGTNGYVHTEEVKQRMSEAQIAYFENPEARQRASEAQIAYYENNPDAGKERGERIRRHYENNPEARQKLSEAQIARFENPEARQKMSEARIAYFENPEAKQRISETLIAYFENPEARQRASEARIAYFENNPDAKRKMLDGRGQNKPFDIFTKEGAFIKTFNYQFEAREYLQKEHHITSTFNISKVLSGKRSSSAGFVFKYK